MRSLGVSLIALALATGCSSSSSGTPGVTDAATDVVDVVTPAKDVTADDRPIVTDAPSPDAPVTPDVPAIDAPDVPAIDAPDVPAIDAPDVPAIDAPAAPDVPAVDTVVVDTPPPIDTPTAPDVAAPVDVGAPDAGPCGLCPRGFTCGAGNVCRSPSGVPHFGQVYMIVMENTSLRSLRGNASAPYLNGLLSTAAVASGFQSVTHPSLPNYIALTSGSPQGIDCDCQPGTASRACIPIVCLAFSDCNCNRNVTHLGDQLDAAMLPWREYGQSMGTACNTVNSGAYVMKHVPFLYYDNVRTNRARCTERVRDYGDFMADRGRYAFSLISPDMCHDMHDSCAPTNDRVRQGDDWLRANVPVVTSAPGFSTDGVLFIVWDEGDLSLTNDIVLLAISPLVRGGTTSTRAYNHYSILATVQDGLGVARLGGSAGAAVMTDLFR